MSDNHINTTGDCLWCDDEWRDFEYSDKAAEVTS